jgi:hypothetical protein
MLHTLRTYNPLRTPWRIGLLLAVLLCCVSTTQARAQGVLTTATAPAEWQADLAAQRAALAPDDLEGRLELCRWCRQRALWVPMSELAHEALNIDPEARVAWGFLRDYDENVALPTDDAAAAALSKELKSRLKHSFQTRLSRHFLIAYDTTDAFAAMRGAALEKAYDAFMYWFNMKRLRPQFLTQRLPVVLIKDRDDFLAYAKLVDGATLTWAAGYYSQRTNRSCFYDDSTSPEAEQVHQKIDGYRAELKQLAIQANQAEAAGQAHAANALMAQRNVLSQEILRLSARLDNLIGQANTIKTVHEACHQLAFNTGIQKRGVDYPLWLSEGLACAFETPEHQNAGAEERRGPMVLSMPRIASVRAALNDRTFVSLDDLLSGPTSLIQVSPPAGGVSGTGTLPNSGPGPVQQVQKDFSEKDINLFYSESWALFHYLYKFQRPALEKYLLALRERKAFAAIPADAQRKLFTDAFGGDLDGMDKRWRAYMKDFR